MQSSRLRSDATSSYEFTKRTHYYCPNLLCRRLPRAQLKKYLWLSELHSQAIHFSSSYFLILNKFWLFVCFQVIIKNQWLKSYCKFDMNPISWTIENCLIFLYLEISKALLIICFRTLSRFTDSGLHCFNLMSLNPAG